MAVAIRDAATVMLIRDAVDGRGRPGRRGVHAPPQPGQRVRGRGLRVPGGSVDPEDHGPAVEALCRGLSDAEASAVLGVDSGGLAFWVAALRECFEEAGVLLARHADDRGRRRGPPRHHRPGRWRARFAAHRDAVNEAGAGLLDVCRPEDLVLAVDSVHYVSHWITPELAPRRYDTRFFVTAAPPGQVARHDDGETIATIWVRPGDALSREAEARSSCCHRPSTTCGSSGASPRPTRSWHWARQVTDVPTVLPIVLIEDGHLLILRPGDDGYEQALDDRLASDPAVDPALADWPGRSGGPKAGSA